MCMLTRGSDPIRGFAIHNLFRKGYMPPSASSTMSTSATHST